jgi:glutathione peroxidase-family protein
MQTIAPRSLLPIILWEVTKSTPPLNLFASSRLILKGKISIRKMTTFYDFKPRDSKSFPYVLILHSPSIKYRLYNTSQTEKGQPVPLDKYKGKVVLAVNTASKCGFTPQYEGLEKLYGKIKEKYPDDFEILAFPCNQFSGQEPGSDDDIQNFCLVNYGVSFPVMAKTEVNGDHAEPLYEWMKKEKPGLMGLKRIKYVLSTLSFSLSLHPSQPHLALHLSPRVRTENVSCSPALR